KPSGPRDYPSVPCPARRPDTGRSLSWPYCSSPNSTSLESFAEFLAQSQARSKEPGFHRPGRQIQQFGGFFRRKPLYIAQIKDGAKAWWQRADCPLQNSFQFRLGKLLLGIGFPIGEFPHHHIAVFVLGIL